MLERNSSIAFTHKMPHPAHFPHPCPYPARPRAAERAARRVVVRGNIAAAVTSGRQAKGSDLGSTKRGRGDDWPRFFCPSALGFRMIGAIFSVSCRYATFVRPHAALNVVALQGYCSYNNQCASPSTLPSAQRRWPIVAWTLKTQRSSSRASRSKSKTRAGTTANAASSATACCPAVSL